MKSMTGWWLTLVGSAWLKSLSNPLVSLDRFYLPKHQSTSTINWNHMKHIEIKISQKHLWIGLRWHPLTVLHQFFLNLARAIKVSFRTKSLVLFSCVGPSVHVWREIRLWPWLQIEEAKNLDEWWYFILAKSPSKSLDPFESSLRLTSRCRCQGTSDSTAAWVKTAFRLDNSGAFIPPQNGWLQLASHHWLQKCIL